jgi:hypothetical protein
MAKKNKHKTTQHDLKIIAARHRNEFMGRIKYYMDLWGGENTFKLLPDHALEVIYAHRFTTPRLEPEPGLNIKSKLLIDIKDTMIHFLDIRPVEIVKDKPGITLLQYHTIYLTIYYYALMLKDENFHHAKQFRVRFENLIKNHEQLNGQVIDMINSTMILLGAIFSTPDKKYYWFSIDGHVGVNKKEGSYLMFRLFETNPVVHNFSVNDDRRPAFKIGFPFPNIGVKWFEIKPPDDGIRKWMNTYDVYIQSHAIERLFERMDCIITYHLIFELFFSLLNPVIIYENGRMLLTYFFGIHKGGYFVADIVDGKLLLRTFLFLTNEGTPEARKLKEIAGLGKLDIKYWKIDRLKNFIESDIATHPEIKKIFVEAGCGDLFKLNLEGSEAYSGKIHLANEMLKYMGKSSEEKKEDAPDLQTDMILPEEAGRSSPQGE